MGIGTENIRTIAIAGHGQSGKTTLIENLAAVTGTIARAEPVAGGKTVSDYTPEEIERKISIYSALVSINKLERYGDQFLGYSRLFGLYGRSYRCLSVGRNGFNGTRCKIGSAD